MIFVYDNFIFKFALFLDILIKFFMEEKYKVKLIKLTDQFVDNQYQFPFVHTVKSNIRFRLRSKLTYDHQPVLLIQKLNSFDYMLPMKHMIDITSKECKQNFICLSGKYDQDGAWYTELEDKVPGIISFQVAFMLKGSTLALKYGTCDVLFLTQQSFQLRKYRKQTVFPRCIGNYKEWTNYFLRQAQLGYNAFHFAPIQQTGASKSYYSLKDHLLLSGDIFQGTKQQRQNQLSNILTQLRKKKIIFFVDIVLNHASFDAEWVRQCPDALYTLQNTDHLRPAYEVDKIIYQWGNQIKSIMSSEGGQPIQFNEAFLNQIETNLTNSLKELKLYQYFLLTDEVENILLKSVKPRPPPQNIFAKDPADAILEFIQANLCRQCCSRSGVIVKNIKHWEDLNIAYEKQDLIRAAKIFNQKWTKKINQEWIPQIIKNTMGEVRHQYFTNSYRQFSDPYPFVKRYFSKITKKDGTVFYALNNGWVGGCDTKQNFALSRQFYYLRRKVNAWGDLLRIRYGDKPSDSPKAWEYMAAYVKQMARLFDGFRLDNCHGTQLNVAKYMVKQARLANPNIIIFAELFTDTQQQRAYFVRNIGINSTLKQAQHMLSGGGFIHSLHKALGNGARYVGGLNRYMEEKDQIVKYSTRKMPITLVYDTTHDNRTFFQQKIQVLQTPVTVLISLMGTFIGSTKGYDQFYAAKIDVTETDKLYTRDEKSHPTIDKSQVQKVKITFQGDKINQQFKVYGSWDNWKEGTVMNYEDTAKLYWSQIQLTPGKYQYKFNLNQNQWKTHPLKQLNAHKNHQITLTGGQTSFKWLYNNLEQLRKKVSQLSDKFFSYDQYFGFHIGDVVVIIRQGFQHQKSICIIANLSTKPVKMDRNIELPGLIQKADIWKQSQFWVYQGMTFLSDVVYSQNIYEYFDFYYNKQKQKDVLVTNEIPIGFACLIECEKTKEQIDIIRAVRDLVNRPMKIPQLSALDCNLIMYGCTRQEQIKFGCSNYCIPQQGNKQLVYGGFGGIFTDLKKAKKENQLSLGIYDNIRQGNWLLQYYESRLKRIKNLSQISDKVQKVFGMIKQLPRYLIPRYFSDFIYRFCHNVQAKMSCDNKSVFKRKLITASTQFISNFPNQLPGFQTTLAAGLPHFSEGWSRCWGRDTFTANQLLLQFPQVYKQSILQFASALRHGLIPNLLDGGHHPRYNSRDACWWFIRAIKQYCRKTKNFEFLKQKVNMLFLSNDLLEHIKLKKQGKSKTMTIQQIVHDIFQAHAHGIFFREWRGGYEIDSNMATQGFNIHIQVDQKTGFIIGGNNLNCLTWMDKMGSSTKAGTKGYPATPRAGSPVQLTALLKNCLSSFSQLNKQGYYSFQSVIFKKRTIKYSEWASLIESNFQKNYYIPLQNDSRNSQDFIRSSMSYQESQNIVSPEIDYKNQQNIRIRGIYKDVFKSQIINQEYRLRPNALIALALAPQMIDPEHAKAYLDNVEEYLLFEKSIGVSTLAEIHQSLYVPYYDNSDDSVQLKVAHGFSYHNGPQWVWLYGFYILAKINFSSGKISRKQMKGLLQEHINYINNDEWCSLPQMTNKNGEFNKFSCPAQAWSISSLLMAYDAIQQNMKPSENQFDL